MSMPVSGTIRVTEVVVIPHVSRVLAVHEHDAIANESC